MPVEITQESLTRSLNGREGLFTFLSDRLNWPLDPEDTFTYDEPEAVGRAAAKAEVSRLVNFSAADPFVIFLVEFRAGFSRTALREILRGVRRRIRERAAYNTVSLDEIVFVCATENYGGLRFAHFEEQEGKQPRLRVFGFDRADIGETHTLRKENLSRLRLSLDADDQPDWKACKKDWLEAWNVEKVTNAFFEQYEKTFRAAKGAITGFVGTEKEKQIFTQRVFNRLLFIHFLSKRGWLTFNGRTDYLFALWDGRDETENFYQAHLSPLFFAGLNNPQSLNLVRDNPALFARIGTVPFLNGGLFDKADEEKTNGAVVIPDSVFQDIFHNLFACYNFTIAESTPDDIEVAVDPEMLGKVFEKLITDEDRGSKGAFYTPRSVVVFMCEEAIKGYLSQALPDPEKPDAIERLVNEKDDRAVTVAEARKLLAALEKVRVVDPACGSGAYLLGMMQTIFDLMRLLDTRAQTAQERDNYDRKLAIIQRNLYGVDLEAFAANIAMLRLWLSLIVDYRDADVHNLPPLPNLDFKIECGDSLAAPDPRVYGDIFRTRALDDTDELALLKRKHFHATDGNKGALARQIRDKEAVIARQLSANAPVAPPANAFDWRVRFIEVFRPPAPVADIGGAMNFGGTLAEKPEPGGFHIVIANPPYGGTPVPAETVQRIFPRAEGPMSNDLYGIFMARALELLAPGGQFCFIVSNTWRTIKSFKPLRKRLAEKTTVRHVLDLPNWIFEAMVNTGIVTLTNAPPPEKHELIAGDLTGIEKNDWHTLEANLRLIAAHGVDVQTTTYARYTYPQATIGTYDNYSFFIASPRLYALMSDSRFTKLGAIADVRQGLATADNEYYLRKRDGVRGSYRLLDESELLTDAEIAALTDDEKQNGVDPARHGGRHFVPYDKGGESDAEGGWMPNYHVPTGYFIDWSKAAVNRLRTATIADVKTRKGETGKIKPGDSATRAAVIRNPQYYFRAGVTFSPTGIYSPSFRKGAGGVFGNKGSTIFSDTLSPEATMGHAGNIVARYLLKNYASHTVETGEEVLGQLPLPLFDEGAKVQLENLVAAIVEKQKADPRYLYHRHEQKEIDALVCQLYGLTDDDIREVTLWYCRRYDKLAAAQRVTSQVHADYQAYLDRAAQILNKPASYWRSHPLLTRIAEGEGHTLDFKEFLAVDKFGNPDRSGGKHVARVVAAFLNTDGGTVLLGVSDAGRIVGLDRDMAHVPRRNEDGLLLKVREILDNFLDPAPRGNVEISFDPLPEGAICVITVAPAVGATYLEDKVYLRDGNRTAELSGRELVEWSAKRRGGRSGN